MQAAGRPVDAVALNAGVGAGGAFADETDLQDELRLVDLNVRSTVHLAKHVARVPAFAGVPNAAGALPDRRARIVWATVLALLAATAALTDYEAPADS